jgi:hypothetical protein
VIYCSKSGPLKWGLRRGEVAKSRNSGVWCRSLGTPFASPRLRGPAAVPLPRLRHAACTLNVQTTLLHETTSGLQTRASPSAAKFNDVHSHHSSFVWDPWTSIGAQNFCHECVVNALILSYQCCQYRPVLVLPNDIKIKILLGRLERIATPRKAMGKLFPAKQAK